MYLIVSASEMGCQFSTQQLGVASCYYYMQVGAEEAVYEQMPSFYILHLIEKDVVDVCAVYLVDAREDSVEVLSFHLPYFPDF